MMDFRPYLLFTALLFFGASLSGQQLENVVVSATESNPSGSSGGKLYWTLGELMVEYYPNGAALDQGYLQSRFLITPVRDLDGDAAPWRLAVWPNPVAAGTLNIDAGAALRMTLYDALGRVVWQSGEITQLQTLDLNDAPAGSYWLQAVDTNGRSRAVQIQKL